MSAKFILDFYNGNDGYSDGQIETEILEYLKRNDDVEDILKEDSRWPVIYHLSPIRENMLRWYPFKNNASVLEIGAGMGALTGVLCDKCTHVTAIELSKRRGEAIRLRHGHRDNLDIYIGNLNEIKLEKKFDYITLIGVLEYACSFTEGENPYRDFLQNISKLLKPDGRLLIAIENRFGLKYWCGAMEDHTGKPFEGINGYSPNSKAKTFDKAALEEMLNDLGFGNIEFYYPAPDYKLPSCIVADGYTKAYNRIWNKGSLYYDSPILTIDENCVSDAITRNKVTSFFANSFFIDCGRAQLINDRKVNFATFTNERKSEYRQYTVIYNDGGVIKRAWSRDSILHLEKICKNNTLLKQAQIDTINEVFYEESVNSEFCHYDTLEEVLLRLIKERDISKINDIFQFYRNMIFEFMPKSKVFIDLIFSNCFYYEGKLLAFDQEWVDENVCPEFVIYRAIRYLYQNNSFINDYLGIEGAYELMGIGKEDIPKYDQREKEFLSSITESYVTDFLNKYSYSEWYNIENILNRKTDFISEKEREIYEKDEYIKYINGEKILQAELLERKEKEINEKDEYIKYVSEELKLNKELLEHKERENFEKEKHIAFLEEELQVKKSIKRWLKKYMKRKSDK